MTALRDRLLRRPDQSAVAKKYGAQYENFATRGDWQVSGVGSSGVADPVNTRAGGAGLKLTSGVGQNVFATKAVNWDLSAVDVMRLSFFFTTPAEGLTLYFGQGGAFTNGFSKTWTLARDVDANNPYAAGWNTFTFPKSDLIVSGTGNWANPIDMFRVRLEVLSGVSTVTTFDEFRAGAKLAGGVAFMFDDAFDSAITEGWAYLRPRGVPCTIYVTSSLVGNAGYVTESQVIAAASEGCVVGNHSATHVSLKELTQGEVEDQLGICRAYLAALGITTGDHVAYPLGATNKTVLAAWKAAGCKTGRGGGQTHIPWPVPPASLTYVSLGNTTSLAAAKTLIDNAIAGGYIVHLVCHKLIAGAPATSTEWNIDDFHALVDYALSTGVRCYDIEQLYRESLRWRP